MTTLIKDLRDAMEPLPANASEDTLNLFCLDRLAQVSSAISLKRIADSLERISACADGQYPDAFRVIQQT